MTEETKSNDYIAIIGMAGRFPGADSIDTFWKNMCDKKDVRTKFSDEELSSAGFHPRFMSNPNYIRHKPVLKDVDKFDNEFFGFTVHEAELIDPQQRILLEVAWEALEYAGYVPDTYKGWISIFAGCSENTYVSTHLDTRYATLPTQQILEQRVANEKDYLATRVAYKLNLKGPAFTIQAACATSLVAIHNACQNLLSYNCDMALAGGIAVDFPRAMGYVYQEGSIFSADGTCRPFDANASGTLFGEGAGLVLLKRYEDAVTDGDTVLALIRGSGINNDGSQRAGFTAPSVHGQKAVLQMAHYAADVKPEDISFVETHGTGTSVGDPIEFTALKQVFEESTNKKNFCILGAVKGSIGHSNNAAGVISIIKTILCFQNKKLPPVMHFEKPNSRIDLDNSPFIINKEVVSWDTIGNPRIAGVSSFGVGGTNVHIILQEANNEHVKKTKDDQNKTLLLLSAHNELALTQKKIDLAAFIQKNETVSLNDIGFTLRYGRKELNHRCFIICDDKNNCFDKLNLNSKNYNVLPKKDQRIIFSFSGQGSQYCGMGQELYDTFPEIKSMMDDGFNYLSNNHGISLKSAIYPIGNKHNDELMQTKNTQLALFILEYSLARYLMSNGITPEVMIGHSLGEISAATISGVLSYHDALELVHIRSSLMQSCKPGNMIAVFTNPEYLNSILIDKISIAAVNGPRLCVVSGDKEDIEKFQLILAEKEIEFKPLVTSHAFHSYMMEPICTEFAARISKLSFNTPQIPFISNVNGKLITPEQAINPQYWASQIRNAVMFADGVKTLLTFKPKVNIEIGPGKTICTLMKQNKDCSEIQMFQTLDGPDKKITDSEKILEVFAALWALGFQINIPDQNASSGKRIPLTPYPFQRKSLIKKIDQFNQNSSSDHIGMNTMMYNFNWKATFPAYREFDEKKNWLFFKKDDAISNEILSKAIANNQTVIVIECGTVFEKKNDNNYTININNSEHYIQLIENLIKDEIKIDVVVHSLSLHNPIVPDTELKYSYFSVLYLLQAKIEMHIQPKIAVITSGAFAVGPDIIPDPSNATLAGLLRTVTHEDKKCHWKLIDINVPKNNRIQNDLTDNILNEINSYDGDREVVLRGTEKYICECKGLQLDEHKTLLKDNGVYIITGGLGGVGLGIADFLSKKCKARIILVGRSEFIKREEWDDYLSSDVALIDTVEKINTIKNLENNGSKVIIISADISKHGEAEKVFETAENNFGQVNGIFHAAGVAGSSMIIKKTKEQADRVLAPKVSATVNIGSIAKDKNIDFIIFYSSVFGVTSGIGQSEYAGGNCFMDSYAVYFNRMYGIPAYSLNWDAWSQIGMAVKHGFTKSSLKEGPFWNKKGISPVIDIVKEAADGFTAQKKLVITKEWTLYEHRMKNSSIVPSVFYLEMVLAAVNVIFTGKNISIRNYMLREQLYVMEMDCKTIELKILKIDGTYSFTIYDINNPSCILVSGELDTIAVANEKIIYDDIMNKCTKLENDFLFKKINESGILQWGPRWNCIEQIASNNQSAIAKIHLGDKFSDELKDFIFHPAMTDIATAITVCTEMKEGNFLPIGIGSLSYKNRMPGTFISYVQKKQSESDEIVLADITLCSEDGVVFAKITDYKLKRIKKVQNTKATSDDSFDGISPEKAFAITDLVLQQMSIFNIMVTPRDMIPYYNKIRKYVTESKIDSSTDDTDGNEFSSDEIEERLAEIWNGIFGQKPQNPDINFFEFGGHSLLMVQLLNRIKEEFCMSLTIEDLVRLDTIRKQSSYIKDVGNESGEQADGGTLEKLSGEFKLTPAQFWLLTESNVSNINKHNIPTVNDFDPDFDYNAGVEALKYLIEFHDGLRTKFILKEGKWLQVISDFKDKIPLTFVDLSRQNDSEQKAEMDRYLNLAHNSFDIEKGPLFEIQIFKIGINRPSKMQVAIHHLLADFSAMIMITVDFSIAYSQIKKKEYVKLAPKSASVPDWINEFVTFGKSEASNKELDYWLTQSWDKVKPLPRDVTDKSITMCVANQLKMQKCLDEETTDVLLSKIPAKFKVGIDEILLSILVNSLAKWSKSDHHVINMVDSGRIVNLNGKVVDVSRTLGWFTLSKILLLQDNNFQNPIDNIFDIQTQISRIPYGGLGFNYLHYDEDRTRANKWDSTVKLPEVLLNYFGNIENMVIPTIDEMKELEELSKKYKEVNEDKSMSVVCDKDDVILNPIEFTIVVSEKKLYTVWEFNSALYSKESLDILANYFIEQAIAYKEAYDRGIV